jgi:hypothetical protein
VPLRPGEESLRSGGNWLVGEDYYGLTRNYRDSFFRLQVHPVYKVGWETEEFQRFLETGVRSIDPNDPRLVKMRNRKENGRASQRVYVITPPLTDYQRFVFAYYHHSAEAGEDLRILDLSRTANPGLPDYDFILLDAQTVIKLHYQADGTYLGRELLPEADPAGYMRYKEVAVAHSMPFLEYEKLISD